MFTLRLRRATVGALLAAMLASVVAPPSALAQSGRAAPPKRTPRSLALAIVGALAGGVLGIGYSFAAGQNLKGSCIKVRCVIVGSVAAGALFGYFVGREYDKNYAMRYRGFAPLEPENEEVALIGTPAVLAARDHLVAVGGSDGVQLFQSAETLTPGPRRAQGLRGIDAVGIAPDGGWLALGSQSGLYVFPPGLRPGMLVREGDVGAATIYRDHVYFAVDSRIEVAPVHTDSVHPWPGATLFGQARDIAIDHDRNVLWAATDSELLGFRITADSLLPAGTAPLEGARRLTVRGDRAAAALGERGVRLFDISDPAAPHLVASWTEARFAYDVSLDGRRMFVAAGPEGVYVVDVSGPGLRTLGLARSLGFASALVSHDGRTYILDQHSNALRRIYSAF